MRADSRMMKRLNRKTLRDTLRRCQTATKPELAAMTGLSVVTINALIAELVSAGEVVKNGLVPSEGGRPSMQYGYNNGYQYAAILYCYQKKGRTFASCLVSDLSGKSVWRAEEYFEEIEISSFAHLLDQAFSAVPKISIIAFGLPGEAIDGKVTINYYKKLIGAQFLPYYEERYQVPVVFENDINAMTYGYYCSRGKKEDVVVGIYFPKRYAPGAGIILNQKIYYGTQHFAGEMERLPVPIPWEELDYEDGEKVLRELKGIVGIFCCTLAPAKFILYGDFFSPSLIRDLIQYTREFLNHSFYVQIEVAEEIEKDYEEGLINLVLAEMERQIEDLEEN